jgi:DNA-binding transcriptional ArsR family regulator
MLLFISRGDGVSEKNATGSGRDDQADVYTISSLEQVKVVADPLRVRILETIVLEPRTTKQIAELLGEKPTRLYHHVDALADAGLIRLVDTRPVRGTTEKYYQAVARSFRTDPGLFSGGDAGDDEARALADVATTVFHNVAEEVRELVLSGYDLSTADDGLLSYVEVHASDDEIRVLHDRLLAFLTELQETCCDDDGETAEDARRYRFSLAWFPLDRTTTDTE